MKHALISAQLKVFVFITHKLLSDTDCTTQMEERLTERFLQRLCVILTGYPRDSILLNVFTMKELRYLLTLIVDTQVGKNTVTNPVSYQNNNSHPWPYIIITCLLKKDADVQITELLNENLWGWDPGISIQCKNYPSDSCAHQR